MHGVGADEVLRSFGSRPHSTRGVSEFSPPCCRPLKENSSLADWIQVSAEHVLRSVSAALLRAGAG